MPQLHIGRLRADAPAPVLQHLVAIVNAAYVESEHDITGLHFRRTNAGDFAALVRAGEVFVVTSDADLLVPEGSDVIETSGAVPADADDPAATIFGVFKLHALAPALTSFGMLVVPPAYRRAHKLGAHMLAFAERIVRAGTVQIELLRPTDGAPHAFKDFLQAWYARAGYALVRTEGTEEVLRGKDVEMVRPAEFLILQKTLA
jgi:hypothetical protein